MELISVIVPMYNAERYLKECIQSILAQTYSNIEILLIDDGSTDSTPYICAQYAQECSKVRYFGMQNRGVSHARNIGMNEARGEVVCFVDSDDCIEKEFLEILYKILIDEKVDVVFCNHKLLYDRTCVKRRPRLSEGKYYVHDIESRMIDDGTITGILFGSVCTGLYRINKIRDNKILFPESIKRNEDGIFNLCLLQCLDYIYVTDYDGYLYRQWKNRKNSLVEWDIELDKATAYILACCKNVKALDIQISRREISVFFWNAIKVVDAQAPLFSLCRQLKVYLQEYSLESVYQTLNVKDLNWQKKVMIGMLKNNRVFEFIITIKYAYPLLRKFMKH